MDGPRRASTTEIYSHYAPDPTHGAAFAQRAFGDGGVGDDLSAEANDAPRLPGLEGEMRRRPGQRS